MDIARWQLQPCVPYRISLRLLNVFKRETGIELEVIHGTTESALSRRALVQAVGGVDARTLLVDLGGGSLELERADGRYRMSTPLGTVRLMNKLSRAFPTDVASCDFENARAGSTRFKKEVGPPGSGMGRWGAAET